ncbi:MAG: hypothetical protein VYC39_19270, partial [Myxococcota bacterium]|nr:hypothetical protein [Myxococcota bacterium]
SPLGFGGDILSREGNNVDLHAQTALYSDTKVKNLENPQAPSGNSALPTASGPLVIQEKNLGGLEPRQTRTKKGQQKLFFAKLLFVIGILVFFYALFIQDS